MRKILIVEDEFPIALDIETRLTKLKYHVIGIANNYEMASILLSNQKPDMVLLDINLGKGKSGLDLAKGLCSSDIPFIFITAYSDDFTFKSCLQYNPSGFIVKPVTDKLLFHHLEIAFTKIKPKENTEFLSNLNDYSLKIQHIKIVPQGWEALSEREKEIVLLLGNGYSDKDLADKLFVSVTTIRTHLRRAYDKLSCSSRLEVVSLLMKHKML